MKKNKLIEKILQVEWDCLRLERETRKAKKQRTKLYKELRKHVCYF